MQAIGKILIYAGLLLLIGGLAVYFFHDKLSWLGNLPGDIRIERDNVKIYIPITTMLILSLLLSVILWIIRVLS